MGKAVGSVLGGKAPKMKSMGGAQFQPLLTRQVKVQLLVLKKVTVLI